MVKRSNRLTSKQVLSITGAQARKMSRNELAQAVSTLASAGNKRIKRMEQAGQPIGDTVDRFSVAGKTKNELMKELRRARDFMQAETQSLSGQKRMHRETLRGLARAIAGTDASKYQYEKVRKQFKDVLGEAGSKKSDTFWRAYERLKENNPIIAQKQYKYKVLAKQAQIMQGKPNISAASLQKRMQKEMEEIYTETQETTETPGDAFTF